MPYSGLAAGGTGTRTGASAGAPVDDWAIPVEGNSVPSTVANASMAVSLRSMVISVVGWCDAEDPA
jgi:hypothetical protein